MNIKTYVIASSKTPVKGKGVEFLHLIRDAAHEDAGIVLQAGVVTDGPGCTNYGLAFEDHPELEAWMRQFVMQMQPAKYGETADTLAPGSWADERVECGANLLTLPGR